MMNDPQKRTKSTRTPSESQGDIAIFQITCSFFKVYLKYQFIEFVEAFLIKNIRIFNYISDVSKRKTN